MYIKNGICYAGKFEEGIKVSEVKPLRGMMMLVTFSTGEKRLVHHYFTPLQTARKVITL